MLLKRVASLAMFVMAVTPMSLFAQALIASTAPALNASFQFVPNFAFQAASASAPAPHARSASASLIAALDASSKFDADIAAAATTQVLTKMPRKRVADFAMKLRDIRYRRGGHEPTTGFDCSGFVHYVYANTFGVELPYDAPSQFLKGTKVASREQMRTGDLVFFHEGKRISHVGIYLDNGRFIHSPSPGKRVRVDSLDETYWAKRYAGAKRPSVIS
jgi:cell wall-associated NlpC family hydrolase